ncbi:MULTISPECIES: phage tail protein [Nocardia]|uniref:phage tail protein n=1 Tax=Nocardia TaxID=1817 RepID=UPI000837538B|nr:MULTISPECIES: phage tail protein [Nocardia]
MAMFSVNSTRIDPYSNFRFLVVFGNDVVAGASKVSGLKQTIELVEHRDGGDLSTKRKSPGLTSFEPITIERGISHDPAFEEWANLAYSPEGPGRVSLKNFRRDIIIELYNLQGVKVRAWNAFRCWVSEFTAVPELDANANAIAFESIVLQNEGFARDPAVVEPVER